MSKLRKRFFSICLILLAHGTSLQAQETDKLVVLHTDFGDIKLLLFDETPKHKENFLRLAAAGVYNHILFHRVIDNFMIQSGDFTTRNQPIDYDPTIIKSTIPAEIIPGFEHKRGAIGAARRGKERNPELRSSGSQFYIIQSCTGAHHLDEKYTVFGQVMSGMEVVDKIAKVATDERDRPLESIRMTVKVLEVSRESVEKFYNFRY